MIFKIINIMKLKTQIKIKKLKPIKINETEKKMNEFLHFI